MRFCRGAGSGRGPADNIPAIDTWATICGPICKGCAASATRTRRQRTRRMLGRGRMLLLRRHLRLRACSPLARREPNVVNVLGGGGGSNLGHLPSVAHGSSLIFTDEYTFRFAYLLQIKLVRSLNTCPVK
jgi:hypothetical protein